MASSVSLRENALHLLKGDLSLREHVIYLLNGDSAHLDFDTAVKDIPTALHGKKPKEAAHTLWQLLEHLRITQADILGSLRDAGHQSPEFPSGYWPNTEAPPNEKAWNKSADEFRADHKAVMELVTSKSADLLAPLPGTDGQTILRKLLMLADHNSYHLGEMVVLRRLLGAWPE
jgi:uncharacterized damage-inducible protein DinB